MESVPQQGEFWFQFICAQSDVHSDTISGRQKDFRKLLRMEHSIDRELYIVNQNSQYTMRTRLRTGERIAFRTTKRRYLCFRWERGKSSLF